MCGHLHRDECLDRGECLDWGERQDRSECLGNLLEVGFWIGEIN